MVSIQHSSSGITPGWMKSNGSRSMTRWVSRPAHSCKISAHKAAYYNKQKFWPGNVLFWSFDIVLRLNRELGGVWRLGVICSTNWGGSRTFSHFSVVAVLILAKQGFLSKKNLERSTREKFAILAKQGFLSKKNLERSNTEKCGEFLSTWPL